MYCEDYEVLLVILEVCWDVWWVIVVGTIIVWVFELVVWYGLDGWTDLFICFGFGFFVVDVFLINFYFFWFSLLVFLEVFVGLWWWDFYVTVFDESYRFLFFGDVMFVGWVDVKWEEIFW